MLLSVPGSPGLLRTWQTQDTARGTEQRNRGTEHTSTVEWSIYLQRNRAYITEEQGIHLLQTEHTSTEEQSTHQQKNRVYIYKRKEHTSTEEQSIHQQKNRAYIHLQKNRAYIYRGTEHTSTEEWSIH